MVYRNPTFMENYPVPCANLRKFSRFFAHMEFCKNQQRFDERLNALFKRCAAGSLAASSSIPGLKKDLGAIP